jgi:Fe(3+) dicitrate transport protein
MPPSPAAWFILVALLFSPLSTAAQSPGPVTGRVTSTAGSPLAGAEIALQPLDGPAITVTAGSDGAFAFPAVAPGEYRLVAAAIGFSPISQPIRVESTAPLEISLVLPAVVHERVNVVGGTSVVERIPGAAHVIGPTEMSRVQMATDDINQMLRQVPGLNLQEEDGYGLRPNIGIRGTGSDRSSKITLMEDGVLIAPAPYAAPAAYYSPIPGRMESLEVRKGSSQIKYGPITTGGVLNYVSTSIPSNLTLRSTLSGGGDSTRKIAASVGDSHGRVGWLLETFQFRTNGFKELDGGGDTGVDLENYLGKLRFNTVPTPDGYQEFEIKLARTEQLGDETYLGLVDADFARTPLRRYAASQMDVFDSTHTQYQARHLFARARWDLTTVAYRNNFHRAWYKLESVMGSGLSAVLRSPDQQAERLSVLRGGDSAPNALVVRNNNRTYFSGGVQSVFATSTTTGRLRHHVEIGARYHQDEEDRFQQDDGYQMLNGRMFLTRAGAPGSQTNQVVGVTALAGFVSDTIAAGRWTISPGLRYESLDLERLTFATSDPGRTGTHATLATRVTAAIPGVGVSYTFRPGAAFFGGLHRGFAPPGPGAAEGTEVEHSVNYEIGTRLHRGAADLELVGFFNDYGNLLGRDTLATGGTGDGDLFNGGDARVYGLEATAGWNPAARFGLSSSLPIRLTYSFTKAEFRHAFQSQFAPWGNVQVGDELPYVPRHQLHASLETDHRVWRARVEAYHVGRMRTLAGQGPYLAADSTDAYSVLSVSGDYELRKGVRVFASLQNVTDNVYIVSRHPAGVRPGLPRLFQAGLKIDLGR